ncbi:MAG: response regulator [Sulfitobacter sp.]|jgi:CheY-like chemotaxis protein|nr:response regulator [Sulfitobacter sp.]
MTELTKILHLEDDHEILQITGMALEMIGGYTILQLDRGEKALSAIEEFAPQLILSDVQMPGLTGPEAVAEIRKIPGYENIPTIYLTARLMNGSPNLLVHSQDWAIIGKPFDPTTLADEIRDVWNAKQ